LHLTEAARLALVDEGYDPLYGARPLKRTLQKRLLDPLAMAVLQGEFHEGDEITLDIVDGALRFDRRHAVVH
jgi:ATP-dependent Clp protease ATP-binding subunit ClpA